MTYNSGRRAITALTGLSFTVDAGEVFGILGPNGAGKTTLMRILATLLLPTAGAARILGWDVAVASREVRRRINFVSGGERGIYWRLSGAENLRYFSDLYGVPRCVQARRIPELLAAVGLEKRSRDRVETYSRGMKQRLQIARGLVNDPKVLLLDEPTIGLDPQGAAEMRGLIARLANQGKTVLLASHYMHEVEQLCRRVIVMSSGRVAASGRPGDLKNYAAGLSVLEFSVLFLPPEKLSSLRQLDGVVTCVVKHEDQRVRLEMQAQDAWKLVPKALKCLGTEPQDLRVREATLEDAYLRLVGGDGT